MIDDLFKLNRNTIQHLPNYSGETLWPFGLRSASSVLFLSKAKETAFGNCFSVAGYSLNQWTDY